MGKTTLWENKTRLKKRDKRPQQKQQRPRPNSHRNGIRAAGNVFALTAGNRGAKGLPKNAAAA